MRRRSLLVLGLGLVLGLALLVGRARALGTLDQSNITGTNVSVGVGGGEPRIVIGQTFTAGISGQLDTVALDLAAPFPNTTATVTIFSTDATGLPLASLASGTATVTLTAPPTGPAQYTVVTFSSPATVSAGTVYAIVLSNALPTGSAVGWFGQIPSAYAKGQAILSANGAAGPFGALGSLSFDFQTFVTPPAPTAPVVTFISPEFGLAVTGCGTTTPSPGPVFVNNLQNVIVTAIPCPGSRFTGWTNGPCNGTTINPCDVSPTAGMITANFTP